MMTEPPCSLDTTSVRSRTQLESSRCRVCVLALVTVVASLYLRADRWNIASRASVQGIAFIGDNGGSLKIEQPEPISDDASHARSVGPSALANSYDDAAYDDDPFDVGPPVIITEGSHVSSPPPTGPCSCWNDTRECCERGVHPSHKFGHLLVDTLFGERYNPKWNGESYSTIHPSVDQYFNRSKDYREVFVTRDWYDALVSGYLFHKSGHECWVNGKTGEIHRVHDNCKCTEENTLPFLQSPSPFPPFRGRDMCHYLAEEDEEDGFRVYSEWVIRRYYAAIVTTFKAVQQEEDPRHRRTLFLCFEDLADPVTKPAVTKKIVDWLYPGGQEGHLPSVADTTDFTDVHATSHDPHLRNHLLSVVRRVDKQAFHGGIKRLSDMFGCGNDLRYQRKKE